MQSIEYLSFEASSYCGGNCFFCPQDRYQLRNQTMPFEIFKKAVDEAAPMGLKLISFGVMGDSWLDKGLGEKLKYVKHNYPNVQTYIATTGHVIDFDLVKYFDVIKLSNYGFTKGTFESMHGGSVKFEDAQLNIKTLLSLPNERRGGVHIYMSYLLTQRNAHEKDAWLEYWEPKVDEISIWKLCNVGGAIEVDALDDIEYNGPAKSCGRGLSGNMAIRVNGLVSMCCFDNFLDLVIGDLREESFADMFANSEMFRRIVKVHKSNNFVACGLICEKCDQIYDRTDALIYTNAGRKIGSIAAKGTSISHYVQE